MKKFKEKFEGGLEILEKIEGVDWEKKMILLNDFYNLKEFEEYIIQPVFLSDYELQQLQWLDQWAIDIHINTVTK